MYGASTGNDSILLEHPDNPRKILTIQQVLLIGAPVDGTYSRTGFRLLSRAPSDSLLLYFLEVGF
jgi:hypothetical protein